MTDNPFRAPDGADLPQGANVGDRLDPVPLDVGAVLTRCWELFQRTPGVVLGSVLLPAVPQFVGTIGMTILDQLVQQARDEQQILVLFSVRMGIQLVTSLVGLWLTLGQCRIYTRLARGLDAEVLMLFGEARTMPTAFLASILLMAGVSAGLCLFVVPGIALAIGWGFAFFAMVDQDLGPVDALSESWRLSDGRKLQVFVVGLLLGLLGLVGSCATLGLGALVLLPVLTLAQGVMYHSLLHEKGPRPA